MDHGTEPVRWSVTDHSWGPTYHLPNLPGADSPAWEARYENDTERHKRTTRRIDDVYGLRPIFDQLLSPRLVASCSEWLGHPLETDPTLHGGGLHVTAPGGWLSTHLDYDLHPLLSGKRRAVNLILFLNPEWHEEWGGALVLCDPMGQVVKRFYPAPGRLVAFEVGDLSYHGVEPITGPVERVTAAVYYLTAAGPHNTRRRALFMPHR